jgi:hypothetical protein
MKNAEQRTPHLLSWNRDIVAWSQKEKCGLKYVMQIASRPRQTNSKRQSHCWPRLWSIFPKTRYQPHRVVIKFLDSFCSKSRIFSSSDLGLIFPCWAV